MLPPLSRVAWGRRPGLSSARAAVARCCVGLDGHHRARNASLPRRDEILGRPKEIAWPCRSVTQGAGAMSVPTVHV
jgi:hypothetical protein